MQGTSDTFTLQKTALGESNTNTVTVTLNAITNERHVIDQIVWSAEEVPGPGGGHVKIFDNTANTTLWRVDVTAIGHAYHDFGQRGLICNLNTEIIATLVVNSATTDNHLFILYR